MRLTNLDVSGGRATTAFSFSGTRRSEYRLGPRLAEGTSGTGAVDVDDEV
jgi:hypothetical protein